MIINFIFLILFHPAFSAEPKIGIKDIKSEALPVYPIFPRENNSLISIEGHPQTMKSETYKELIALRESKKTEFDFYIEGELADKILKDLGFDAKSKIYFKLFEKNHADSINVSDIKKLYLETNPAGDDLLGAIYIQVPVVSNKAENREYPAGLAWVANENPFTEETLSKTKLIPIKLNEKEQLQMESFVAKENPRAENRKFDKEILSFKDKSGWEFISTVMPDKIGGDSDKTMAYFLKSMVLLFLLSNSTQLLILWLGKLFIRGNF